MGEALIAHQTALPDCIVLLDRSNHALQENGAVVEEARIAQQIVLLVYIVHLD